MSFLTPFLIAFFVSAVGAYPILQLLISLKSRQTVSQYAPEGHQKKQGTPTMGGLIVALGFLAAQGWLWVRTSQVAQLGVFGLFLGFALIGFVDDYVVPRLIVGKRGLGWKQKIVMQLVVAAACCYLIGGGFSLKLGAVVFLVLFFSNAYNFSDGLDALAGLLLLGLASGLLLIAHAVGATGLQPYLAALLGAILPFLYFNRPKARVFMGDVGSLPIGAVLGLVVSCLAFPRFMNGSHGADHASALILVSLVVVSGMMIVELVPVPLQILSVKVRKKKLFSFTPIHHAYEKKGWPELKVVLAFAACQLLLSVVAVGVANFDRHSPSSVSVRRP